MKRSFLSALVAGLLVTGGALAAGYYTNGLDSASFPLTGAETIPADTNLSSGRSPQSESITVNQLKGYARTTSALTDGANVAINASLAEVFTLTLGGNRTLDTPTNLQTGKVYRIIVAQDGTGSRTLSYQGIYKWPGIGGVAPVINVSPSSLSVLTFLYNGTNLLGSSSLGYTP